MKMFGKRKAAAAAAVAANEIEMTEEDYKDTVITMSDEEAHRGVKYDIPSSIKQMIIIAGVQLKLLAKGKLFWGLVVLVLLMPLLVAVGVWTMLEDFMGLACETSGPAYVAGLLGMLPLLACVLIATLMSKPLPSEFKSRTAYLSLALPQARWSFYLGKFLANFLVIVLVIIFGFLEAYLIAVDSNADMSEGGISSALILSILTAFALSSMIFAFSAKSKRGSTFISVIILFIVVQMLAFFLIDGLYNGDPRKFAFAKDIADYLRYIPMMGFDEAIYSIGHSMSASITGYLNREWLMEDIQVGIYMIINLLWGIAFLLFGIKRFEKRQM